MSLYIVAAQPNPRGKDAWHGQTTNEILNEEWVEFTALKDRNLAGDVLSNLTFNHACQRTGEDVLVRFDRGELKEGQRIRVHTGKGSNHWSGSTYHMYAGRTWFAWNNACGDRATLSYQNAVIDSAYYRPNPPEGQLVRLQGTDELVPAPQLTYR